MPINTIGAGSAAGGGALELLYSETVGSGGATSIDTGTLATGYRALVVYAYLRTDTLGMSLDSCDVHFNGDTSSGSTGNYESAFNYGGDLNGGATGNTQRAPLALAAGASATANYFNVNHVTIPNHENTTGFKQATATSSRISKATERISYVNAMLWRSTAAITTLTFTSSNGGDFVEGSAIYVYGVK